MADPISYPKSYSFSSFQASNPTTPLPAAQVDSQLAAIQSSNDSIVAAIKDVRRSDGALHNQIVTPESLSAATRALLPGDVNPRTDGWYAGGVYALKDLVTINGASYVSTVAHTASSAFSTDLAALKWILIASPYSLSGAVFHQEFNGTGAQVNFTLSQSFSDISELQVYVQNGSAGYEYMRGTGTSPQVSLTSATQITFATAPGAGTRNVIVMAVNQTTASSVSQANAAATAAANSATAASTSATSASGSAAAASTSATAAATSATSAAASASAAQGAMQGALYDGTFTGNGSTTVFNLGVPVYAANNVIWEEGGKIQIPGVDYTVTSAGVLTRTTAPGNTVPITWRVISKLIPVNPYNPGWVALQTAIRQLGSTTAKTNVYDGFVDAYFDQTGVNTGASTNLAYDGAGQRYLNYGSLPTGTGLLLHLDSALTDSSSAAVTMSVSGTTTWDTTTFKWGTASFKFNGSSYIFNSSLSSVAVGTGNFSFDFWLNVGATGTNQCPIATNASTGFALYLLASNILQLGVNGTSYNSSLTLTAGVWYWIAIDKNGSTWNVWVGQSGTATNYITATNASSMSVNGLYFGANQSGSLPVSNNTRIDEVLFSTASRFSSAPAVPTGPYGSSSDITLISNTVTIPAGATTGKIMLRHQPIDSVTLNTDLLAYVSSDGGTTWSQATLTNGVAWDGTYNTVVGTATLPGTGTSLAYKIVTSNSKRQVFKGVGVEATT